MFLDVIVDNFDNPITENNGNHSLVIASIAASIVIALCIRLFFVIRWFDGRKRTGYHNRRSISLFYNR